MLLIIIEGLFRNSGNWVIYSKAFPLEKKDASKCLYLVLFYIKE